MISRRLLAAGPRDAADFPVNGAGAERRSFQCQAFGEAAQIVRYAPPLSLVGSASADQSDQAKPPISANPALRGAQRQRRLPGDAHKRRILFQMRTKLVVPLKGPLALSVGQLGQGHARRGVAGGGCHAPAYAR